MRLVDSAREPLAEGLDEHAHGAARVYRAGGCARAIAILGAAIPARSLARLTEPGVSRRLALAGLILLLIGSAWGLLCSRIGDYDDSLLLVGARLVRAGRLPYRDFYAHYGPLGFSLQSALSRIVPQPPLALRTGQAAGLAILCALAFALARPRERAGAAAWTAVAYALALSTAAVLPSFYGFALAVAALAAFALARAAESRRAADGWAAASGALLAAAALTRPAFGIYALAAIAFAGSAIGAPSGNARRLGVFGLALGLAAAGIWLALYRDLPPREIVEATLLLPRRLLEGGGRYELAAFLRAPLPLAYALSLLVACVPLAWAAALPSRRGRALAAVALAACGALPLWLRASVRPARDATLVAVGTLAIVALLALLERPALRTDPVLGGAALFGLAAAGFAHYLWARVDRPHFLPFLAAGAAGAALGSYRLRAAGRLALAALFLFAAFVFARSPDRAAAPIEALWRGGARDTFRLARMPRASWRTAWPCTEIPADALRAVAAADALADPGSRFVAAGSSQAFAGQNPVLLFLLSSRLPYTRWYQYDPGVQNSEPVQREMIRELELSGSRSAVVWLTEIYAAAAESRRETSLPRSPFDDAFDRLYPERGPRFGLYEIRLRAPTPSSGPLR